MTCYEMLLSLSPDSRGSGQKGVYSVCTTHAAVLEAALMRGRRGENLVIETTANQVNQFGGYTGMTAKDFIQRIREKMKILNIPSEAIVFGSDHAGPFPWRNEPEARAMEKARCLVAESVLAGYTKIHIDASMHLADDPGNRTRPLEPRVGARRSAELCKVAEESWESMRGRVPGTPAPLYVIGTDVPAPGGTESGAAEPQVTTAEELEESVALCHETFLSFGLEKAWERVIAVVVQPAVEHGERIVHRYDRKKVQGLVVARKKLIPKTVFEAHATDYQTEGALRQMVQDGFAILKVGPSLTGAVREALFLLEYVEEACSSIEKELKRSKLADVLEQAMVSNPDHWKSYYQGDEAEKRFLRKFGLSDRCRYYWGVPAVTHAVDQLLANLRSVEIPLALLNQYMPRQSLRVQEGALPLDPDSLIRAQVDEVLARYATAVS